MLNLLNTMLPDIVGVFIFCGCSFSCFWNTFFLPYSNKRFNGKKWKKIIQPSIDCKGKNNCHAPHITLCADSSLKLKHPQPWAMVKWGLSVRVFRQPFFQGVFWSGEYARHNCTSRWTKSLWCYPLVRQYLLGSTEIFINGGCHHELPVPHSVAGGSMFGCVGGTVVRPE